MSGRSRGECRAQRAQRPAPGPRLHAPRAGSARRRAPRARRGPTPRRRLRPHAAPSGAPNVAPPRTTRRRARAGSHPRRHRGRRRRPPARPSSPRASSRRARAAGPGSGRRRTARRRRAVATRPRRPPRDSRTAARRAPARPPRTGCPRWHGGAGFVEIWFLVVFHPATASALWLRYTTFAPVRGAQAASRAIVWAAWFDATAAEPAVAMKAIHPAEAYGPGTADRFRIRIGPCVLAEGHASGSVSHGGRRLAWDLSFIPAERPADAEPWLLRRLPLPVPVSRPP